MRALIAITPGRIGRRLAYQRVASDAIWCAYAGTLGGERGIASRGKLSDDLVSNRSTGLLVDVVFVNPQWTARPRLSELPTRPSPSPHRRLIDALPSEDVWAKRRGHV